MPAVAIVSVVIAVLVIVVLAAYLIALAIILQRVHAQLRAVVSSIAQIAPRSQPLGPAIETLSLELDQLRGSLRRFVGPPRA